MKSGAIFGGISIAVGLTLMATGNSMCRGTCWIDRLFRTALPENLERTAGGIQWVILGILIIAIEYLARKR
jgi:hypothetical protein